MMDTDPVSCQKKKDEDRIPPENDDDKQNQSLNKNDADQITKNKKKVDNSQILK